jgi:AcrR family transcriptional regulator
MTETTQPKRRYNATRRRAQARETQANIIAAAKVLFTERGYAGATIEAIAQAADVSPETVYAAFGNKQTILARLIAVSVGGDDAPIPLLERPGPQAVLRNDDPRALLHGFARDIAIILARVAPIFEIMRLAAKTEPEINTLLQTLLGQRLGTMRVVAERLIEMNALRPGIDATQAAETLWALSSPEMYQLLLVNRGWSPDRYVAWLGDGLVRVLLA